MEEKTKKYKVQYYLMWDEPEIVEAKDKTEACEQVYEMILDNIGFYIDCNAFEINEEEEDEEEEDD